MSSLLALLFLTALCPLANGLHATWTKYGVDQLTKNGTKLPGNLQQGTDVTKGQLKALGVGPQILELQGIIKLRVHPEEIRKTALPWNDPKAKSPFPMDTIFKPSVVAKTTALAAAGDNGEKRHEAFVKAVGNSHEPYHSDVHMLHGVHVEIFPLTEDVGGLLPARFHEKIAEEADNGMEYFQKVVKPKVEGKARWINPGSSLNDQFFSWQTKLYESGGYIEKTTSGGGLTDQRDNQYGQPDRSQNSTWPAMEGLPEYRALRSIIESLSKRYLRRSGIKPHIVDMMDYSSFSWFANSKRGGFHGPHMHTGEYHVAVFYARVGKNGGKLRFGDPRGQNPPFGKDLVLQPQAGELIIFPAWLSHMATVTHEEDDKEDEHNRVILAINLGPETGPLQCSLWFSDPTGDIRIETADSINPAELGL